MCSDRQNDSNYYGESTDGPGERACVTADRRRQADPMTLSLTFPDTVFADRPTLTVPRRQRPRNCRPIRTCDAATWRRAATKLLSTVTRPEIWFWRDPFGQVASTIYQRQPPYGIGIGIVTITTTIVIISCGLDRLINNHCTQTQPLQQCSRIRILRFSDFKKHNFLRFFEMTYQKVVKSR